MLHEHQHVPVTALALYRDKYILSGEGTYLHVYGFASGLLNRVHVFDGQALHGIAILDTSPIAVALIWGGPLFRLASISVQGDIVHILLGETQCAADWILDATFAAHSDLLAAGLVTAHNAFSTMRVSQPRDTPDNSAPHAALIPRIPGSNCILYSAHLTWLSASQCLIASGTCFGDIIVWSAILDSVGNGHAKSQIHYSFPAHEGSVFGVRLSSRLTIPGFNCERALLSCSDDRTVRLWDVSNLENSTTLSLQQETGFGSRVTEAIRTPRCLARAMGHISRIWHVRYARPVNDDELMRIYTFGEDASVVSWALKANGSSHILIQMHAVRAHTGKNIWAVLVDTQSHIVASGGADGAIALYQEDETSCRTKQIPSALPCDSTKHDNYRAYALVDTNFLITTTDRGRVVLLDLLHSEGIDGATEISASIPGLREYSVITTVPSLGFIGGSDGAIHMYTHSKRGLFTLSRMERKISSLFSQRSVCDRTAILACTVKSTNATLLMIQNPDGHSPYAVQTLQLELPANFVTTSFAHHVSASVNYAVLGSRNGSLAVYIYPVHTLGPLRCSKLCEEFHGKEAITKLRWVLTAEGLESRGRPFLYSTGRDGTFAVQQVILFEDRLELVLVHQLPLPFGPNIEGFRVSLDSNTLVWGFRSKHFVVYDVREQREIMAVDCGGVHRNWAFQPASRGGTFIWTKASKLFLATQSALPYDLIKAGGHGREIKAVAVSHNDSEEIIATGAEDTSIKLCVMEKSKVRCLQTLRKHNTGIQHLAWNGGNLFSSGGFEEFFVWKVSFNIPFVGVGVACESDHPRSGTSDLRIMGFDVRERVDEQDFVMDMAYSDSTLKRWRYGVQKWELLATGDYLTFCLAHVFQTGVDRNSILTASSDGHITRWMLDSDREKLIWRNRHRIHQSAIQEVVCVDLADGGSMIISGGDDNALGITRAEASGKVGTVLVLKAHAAAVTGLAIVPQNDGTYVVASAGIDQRVKIWRISVDAMRSGTDGIEVKRIDDRFTAVADVSSLQLYRAANGEARLLVCGVGMDVWTLTRTA